MRLRVSQGNETDISGDPITVQRVELDGEDVSDAVRALSVEMSSTDMPVVMIAPMVQDLSVELAEPQIYISPAARHLLIKLGWTPPDTDVV